MYLKTVFVVLCVAAFLDYSYAQETEERGLLNTMMEKILLEEYENTPTADGYSFSYKTSDGSVREETGVLMNPGTDNEELVVMGSYSYDDGEVKTTTMYTADENGYRPRVSVQNRKLNPKLLASLSG